MSSTVEKGCSSAVTISLKEESSRTEGEERGRRDGRETEAEEMDRRRSEAELEAGMALRCRGCEAAGHRVRSYTYQGE